MSIAPPGLDEISTPDDIHKYIVGAGCGCVKIDIDCMLKLRTMKIYSGKIYFY
jgi:hypothetical protein